VFVITSSWRLILSVQMTGNRSSSRVLHVPSTIRRSMVGKPSHRCLALQRDTALPPCLRSHDGPSAHYQPSFERGVASVDGILSSIYRCLSTAIDMKQLVKACQHDNLYSLLSLADGEIETSGRRQSKMSFRKSETCARSLAKRARQMAILSRK
jgi:hypothetical protein